MPPADSSPDNTPFTPSPSVAIAQPLTPQQLQSAAQAARPGRSPGSPGSPRGPRKPFRRGHLVLEYLGLHSDPIESAALSRSASGTFKTAGPPTPLAGRVVRDLVGGSISALITLSFSLSFAAMIFTGELAADLGFGIRMALTSAAITVIAVALLSPFRFAIAGPDSRSAAVQSALAAGLVAAFRADAIPTALILLALSLSTVLTGAVLYTCGRLRMGTWIRYVPYPVIGGFLASTGWTLVIGAVRVIISRPLTFGTLSYLTQPGVLSRLAVGVLFTLLLLGVLHRTKHFLALPGCSRWEPWACTRYDWSPA